MNTYKDKYNKYKTKYINLKHGGDDEKKNSYLYLYQIHMKVLIVIYKVLLKIEKI